jgi:hypothetical protein
MKETLIAARDSDEDILACVRNVGRNCQLYPCIKDDNGEFIETDTPESPFGYAGRFVHRDDLVEKPLMQTIGDKGWGSGCVVSDEYKFVYIHVLKSGGTATKEVRLTAFCIQVFDYSFIHKLVLMYTVSEKKSMRRRGYRLQEG